MTEDMMFVNAKWTMSRRVFNAMNGIHGAIAGLNYEERREAVVYGLAEQAVVHVDEIAEADFIREIHSICEYYNAVDVPDADDDRSGEHPAHNGGDSINEKHMLIGTIPNLMTLDEVVKAMTEQYVREILCDDSLAIIEGYVSMFGGDVMEAKTFVDGNTVYRVVNGVVTKRNDL